jgi:hypothetical protein
VSQRGSIMVATQRIHVGMIHARKIVTVTASDHSFQLDIDGETVATVPRTTSTEVHRYKAYATRHAPQTPARRCIMPSTMPVPRRPEEENYRR